MTTPRPPTITLPAACATALFLRCGQARTISKRVAWTRLLRQPAAATARAAMTDTRCARYAAEPCRSLFR